MCLENYSFSSKNNPKCLVHDSLAKGNTIEKERGCMGLLFLTENTTSTACLVMSGLKAIFHSQPQSEIDSRYVSNIICVSLTSVTRTNRDESSANNFMVDMFSGRSSIYTIKSSGPRTDPCGCRLLYISIQNNPLASITKIAFKKFKQRTRYSIKF